MTRKRRYLISAAVLAACICVVLAILALTPSRPSVAKERFDRIKLGMNNEEVNEILGKSGAQAMVGFRSGGEIPSFTWRSEDGTTATIRMSNGLVRQLEWKESTETFPDKLRRWFCLPK